MRGFAIHEDWHGIIFFDLKKRSFFRQSNSKRNSGSFSLTEDALILYWDNWDTTELPKLSRKVFSNEELTIRIMSKSPDDVSQPGSTRVSSAPLLSFDIFDSLLFRKFQTPYSIFEHIESAHGILDFKSNRIACEDEARRRNPRFTYDDIYECMASMYGSEASAIKDLELSVEKAHLFPIWENLHKVNPQRDLLISDMYYDACTLKYLLNGYLNMSSERILVSTQGKSTGSMWSYVGKHYNVRCHLGDNTHSDVRMANKFKISSRLTTLTKFTAHEEYVNRALGLRQLALLIRFLRLQNQFERESAEHAIWTTYHDVYVPYVYMYNCWIRSQVDGYDKIYFCERDMNDAYEMFKCMFDDQAGVADSLHCSRFAFTYPSARTRNYFENKFLERRCLLVDMHGTGTSFNTLTNILRKIRGTKSVFLFSFDGRKHRFSDALVNMNFTNSDFMEKILFNNDGSMINFDNFDRLLVSKLKVSERGMYDMISRRVLDLCASFFEDCRCEAYSSHSVEVNLNKFTEFLRPRLLKGCFWKREFQTYHLNENLRELAKAKSYKSSHMVLFHTRGPPHDGGINLTESCARLRRTFAECIDHFHTYDMSALSKSDIFADIMSRELGELAHAEHNRGVKHGFWFWKPFVIKESLRDMLPNELLFYQDCNTHRFPLLLNTNNAESTLGLIELLFQIAGADIVVPIEDNKLKLKQHCKKDVFTKLGVDNEDFWESPLLNANRILLKKTDLTTSIVDDWYDLCCDPELLLPETKAEADLRWHTHDQALLNVVIRRYMLEGKLPEHYPGFYFQDKVFNLQNVVCC